jgi:phosphoglycolate phosphatase
MTIKLVVFDFDGTIADTYDAFVEIVNNLAGEFGYKPVDQADLARYKNLSSREIVKQSEIPLIKIPFILRRVKLALRDKIKRLKPCQDIAPFLLKLKQNGYSLGIVTSNAQENVLIFLENNGLSSLFDFIYSGNTLFGKHKVIEQVLRNYQLTPAEVVYVGDETRDILAARHSQVKVVAVGWGFNSPEVLIQHHPHAFITHPQELFKVLDGWNQSVAIA